MSVDYQSRKFLDALLEELLAELELRIDAALKRQAEERLLRVDEAAGFCGVSESAMRKHVARGNIPFIRLGTSIRVRLSDVLDACRG